MCVDLNLVDCRSHPRTKNRGELAGYDLLGVA